MLEHAENDDRALCNRVIQGVNAFSHLQDRFRRRMELHLLGHCQRSDGRSQEKAIEIASQVLSDCFAKSPSLLEKWQGNDNLEAFLRTVAYNRLKSWWASRDSETEVNSESRSITEAESGHNRSAVDWDELNEAAAALRSGVDAAIEECAEGLVFLRLKGLHGVDQRVLSSLWGHHEAQTSRRIKEAMTLIRETAARRLENAGHDVEIDILHAALQGNPSILLGGDGEDLDNDALDLLQRLASGDPDREQRRKAIGLMCRNSRATTYFAGLINRTSNETVVVVKDPALAGVEARLQVCMMRAADHLQPSEIRGLITPLMNDLLTDALRSIAAQGGTLWLLSPGEPVLEAIFNPLEPEITGKRQPLVSGIISLALATSESILVEDAGQNHKHSPAVDEALGKTTGSMIAVPFRWMGVTRGVLTAVRFQSLPFGPEETRILEHQSELMAHLLTSSLQSRILE